MSSGSPGSPQQFTILLPTYNRPELTRLALKSCLDQTYPHFKVWVLDDSKTDAVRKVVESMPSEKVTYTHNDPPLGMPRKLNVVLDRIPTKWAVVLGDDDWFEPDYLQHMAKLVEECPQAPIIRVRYKIIDAKGNFFRLDAIEKRELSPAESITSMFRLWYKINRNISGVLFRVDWLLEDKGFPEGFYKGLHVDQLAWSKLSIRGTALFDPTPLVNLRTLDPTSLSAETSRRDYQLLLETTSRGCREARALLKEVEGREASKEERREMKIAAKQIDFFFRDQTDFYMDGVLKEFLRSKEAGSKTAFLQGYGLMKSLGYPIAWYFPYYRVLIELPYPLRRIGLGILGVCRGVWYKLFPHEVTRYYKKEMFVSEEAKKAAQGRPSPAPAA